MQQFYSIRTPSLLTSFSPWCYPSKSWKSEYLLSLIPFSFNFNHQWIWHSFILLNLHIPQLFTKINTSLAQTTQLGIHINCNHHYQELCHAVFAQSHVVRLFTENNINILIWLNSRAEIQALGKSTAIKATLLMLSTKLAFVIKCLMLLNYYWPKTVLIEDSWISPVMELASIAASFCRIKMQGTELIWVDKDGVD